MKKKAFTVIELLVVLAVLSLLTTIVIISIRDSRERARIASILQFSTSIKHGIGAYLIGEWRFEEGFNDTCPTSDLVFNDFCDTSGYKNHGQNFNISVSWVENEIRELGKAGHFDAGDYIIIPFPDTFDYTGSVVFEAWIKPTAFGFQNSILVEHNGDYGFFLVDGKPAFLASSGDWLNSDYLLKAGKWYHYLAVHSGSKMQIFIDGQEVAFTNTAGPVREDIWDSALLIGSRYGATNFEGDIDEVRLYNESLILAQIRQLYAQGAERHPK